MKVAASFFKEVEFYAHEKGMSSKEVLSMIESAISQGLSSYYSIGKIKITISKLDNSVRAVELFDVVYEVKDPKNEKSLKDVREKYPNAKVGEVIENECYFPNMERVVVKKIHDFLTKNLDFMSRDMQYEAFKDKVGYVSSFLVKGVEFGNVIVDIGTGDGLIPKEELINGEKFHVHDRVKGMVYQVLRKDRGFQVLITRTSNEFLMYLLKDSIPEISDGTIEIKAVARIPGKRAKVAVIGHDNKTDPVGTCVGVKGSRISSIVKDLNGERIDIVLWSSDEATFILNSMSPAEVSKIVINENNVVIVVPENQLSIAIGSGGVNIRLVSKITKKIIKVVSENDYNQQKGKELDVIMNKFMSGLLIDEMMARFLIAQGFACFNDILYTSTDAIAVIEGLDEDTAKEIKDRAENYINTTCEKAGLAKDLVDFIEDKDLLLTICQKNADYKNNANYAKDKIGTMGLTDSNASDLEIKSLEDLASLSSGELVEIIASSEFTTEVANGMILQAREKLGWLND